MSKALTNAIAANIAQQGHAVNYYEKYENYYSVLQTPVSNAQTCAFPDWNKRWKSEL